MLRRSPRKAGKEAAELTELRYPVKIPSRPNGKRFKGDEGRRALRFAVLETMYINEAAVSDPLLVRPPTTARALAQVYVTRAGKKNYDDRFKQVSQQAAVRHLYYFPNHPKILAARKNGTYTPQLKHYWERIRPAVNLPLAGTPKTSESRQKGGNASSPERVPEVDSPTSLKKVGRGTKKTVTFALVTQEASLARQIRTRGSAATLIPTTLPTVRCLRGLVSAGACQNHH